jgi:hypothetical protein
MEVVPVYEFQLLLFLLFLLTKILFFSCKSREKSVFANEKIVMIHMHQPLSHARTQTA